MSTFTSPNFEQVLAYWQSVAKDGAPTARQFDFLMIPSALPDITYWDLHPDGRIICRMAGTAVVSRMKTDITGVDLTTVMPAHQSVNILQDFKSMQGTPCGVHYVVHSQHPSGKIARLETLSLPIAAESGGLPKLVSVNHMIETIKHGNEASSEDLNLARELEKRVFIDLGLGVPSVENLDQKSA